MSQRVYFLDCSKTDNLKLSKDALSFNFPQPLSMPAAQPYSSLSSLLSTLSYFIQPLLSPHRWISLSSKTKAFRKLICCLPHSLPLITFRCSHLSTVSYQVLSKCRAFSEWNSVVLFFTFIYLFLAKVWAVSIVIQNKVEIRILIKEVTIYMVRQDMYV